MRTIKRILRTLDFFGESFTFRYQDEDKLSSILGGLICLIFYIIAISYFIYNFIPFCKRENFSLQYYTMNLDNTEEVKLSEPPTAFAIGLDDGDKNQLSDLLEIKIKFKKKDKSSNDNIPDRTLIAHPCTKADFFNHHQKSFDDLDISKFYCLSKNDLISPQGIFTDNIFSYYVISVVSKDPDNQAHNQAITDYLLKNDCKLQFYYTDITININNYKEPFSSVLNSMFLQLNPTLVQKKNIFFMNYHLFDDTLLLHFNQNEEKPEIKTGISRVEDYSLYKGLDRTNEIAGDDYEAYAKIYIRADNRKIEIKRKYQDFMEFYADISGLLLSIFWVLGVIFAYYDRIKANYSISKKLFYFEGIKGNKFDQFKKIKEILNEDKKREKINQNEEEEKIILPIDNNNNISKYSIRQSQNQPLKSDLSQYKTSPKNNNENKENKVQEENDEKSYIDYSGYNLFEMFGSFEFCYCKTKKFENKVHLMKQAKKIIDDKLDIVYYIRNMILFEIINKINLENKNIVNFLSRPIIYLNKEQKKENKENKENEEGINKNFNLDDLTTFSSYEIDLPNMEENKDEQANLKADELYKSAYRLNPDKLTEKIEDLVLNTERNKNQDKLLKCLKKHLKGV